MRSESGQVLPWTVIMLVAALPLMFGVMGAGAAYLAKAQAQMAADAAALAAADQAQLWESLVVSWHQYGCTKEGRGTWTCGDGPSGRSSLGRMYAPALFATEATGLPGWAAAAGCQAVGADPPGTPPVPNPLTVCSAWQLQPGGFGVGYGLGFASGSDPAAAARAYLQANTANLRADGVGVEVVALQADDTTGQVDLAVRVTEPGNPLRLLSGQETTITIESGSQRRIPPPPASGS